jgi:putative ABC transport system permease protein
MTSTLRSTAQDTAQPPSPSTESTRTKRRSWPLKNTIQRSFSTLGGLARMALWRIRYYSGLSLLALMGVIIAVGLVTSAGFFAQAVDQVILDRELAEYTRITQRPPFAARVFASSSATVPFNLARVEILGEDVADTISSEVGLPVKSIIMLADSGGLRLLPDPNDTRYTSGRPLGDASIIHMTGIADHIEIVEGAEFVPDAPASGELLVWMHREYGERLGVQMGDHYTLSSNSGNINIPFVVAGLWSPIDPKSYFWFNDPNQTMNEKLLVTRADYAAWVEPALNPQVRTATWQVILDETKALPANADDYRSGFELAATIIARYLPTGRVTAPTLTLEKFVGQQTALTTLLLGFNVPGLAFLLYFLVLTSAVIAYWQRRETSLLRSRGISRASILNFTLIEAGMLFLVGTPAGLLLGLGLARIMGYTESFLEFVQRAPLPVSVYGINLPLTFGTLGVVLVAKLWTTASTSHETIVTQTREHARPTRGPFWYRNYIDLILILPTLYAYQQFLQRGSLGALVENSPEDLYKDPLLILVPGLFIITFALVFMRFFPLLMRLLDLLAGWAKWLPGYLALRQLGRQSHAYINPLLLVIVSLALGVYTLSMAASMDRWLADRVYHQVGADLSFLPFNAAEAMGERDPGAAWVPPIDEFTMLPGVEHAARVGTFPTEIFVPTGGGSLQVEARFLAIDRIDFPLTAWFRNDYARESMGALMNRLAQLPDGILVSQEFLDQHRLRIGDRLDMLVLPDIGVRLREQFTIVGVYNYFPTAESAPVTVVGNMEYINSFFGIAMPHRIWMRLEPGATRQEVLEAVKSTGIDAIEVKMATEVLNTEQAKMERVGVFGTLTVSFLAATLMAGLGLLTYSYASLHERLYQFSVLRAIGLKRREIISQVGLEYVVLTAYGALAGVACGVLAAYLFVPFFRISVGAGAPLPPLIPIIAQDQIAPLAIVFSLVMIVLELIIISSAFFTRLFEALRMGHQG